MISDLISGQGASLLMAIVIVGVALLALVAVFWLMRNRSASTFIRGGRNRQPRLAVLDAAAVDTRRRLVLVRRDDVEHLILIGGPTDVVIESRIGLSGPVSIPTVLPVEPLNMAAAAKPTADSIPTKTAPPQPRKQETALRQDPSLDISAKASGMPIPSPELPKAAAPQMPVPRPVEPRMEDPRSHDIAPRASVSAAAARPTPAADIRPAPAPAPRSSADPAPPRRDPATTPIPASSPASDTAVASPAANLAAMAAFPAGSLDRPRDLSGRQVAEASPAASRAAAIDALDALDAARARVLPTGFRPAADPLLDPLLDPLPDPVPSADSARKANDLTADVSHDRPMTPVEPVNVAAASSQADIDIQMSDFESVLREELGADMDDFEAEHFGVRPPVPSQPHQSQPAARPPRASLEEEMERLLGDLSIKP